MAQPHSEQVSLNLPRDIEVVDSTHGMRFRGSARDVADAAEALRLLRNRPEGTLAIAGSWSLVVSEFIPASRLDRTIVMPSHAWNIAASVLGDVAYGEYESPFDFADVGYLKPRPDPDIGVEVIGPTLVREWRELGSSSP